MGSKALVAEQLGDYTTIGVDCVAMNANDIICVGATPIAMLDYLAVEQADAQVLREIGQGLKHGAEEAEIEVPGGELAQLPEIIRGVAEGTGFDLSGTCVGLVELDSMITGAACEPGDAIIGLPSSGVHANGLTLARRALGVSGDFSSSAPGPRDLSVLRTLLTPTLIYVRAVRALLETSVDVRGLAHITSDGYLNLRRLEARVGFEIARPLPVPAIFSLIQEAGNVGSAEMYEVFNMGCGFCVVLPADQAPRALEVLTDSFAEADVIGWVTNREDEVHLPSVRLRSAGNHFCKS